MNHESKRTFTLSQLLVLVPIATLLTTMLLAASLDAKQQQQTAACVSHMRQWAISFLMYADDYNDYFPSDGGYPGNVCDGPDTNGWFNVLPQYCAQKSLCQLYTDGTPPTPLTKGVWTCPSATNVTVKPTLSNPYFMYSMNACWHVEGDADVGFRRTRMTHPATTILFCEEPEDSFPNTDGKHDMVTRHFGGSNFVFGDSHVEWIALANFCRAGNPGCPPPLGNIPWDDSGTNGDWKPIIPYHWWPFANANATATEQLRTAKPAGSEAL
jgi:prepilin-type processing-associated H-X9-DG protein